VRFPAGCGAEGNCGDLGVIGAIGGFLK